MRGIAIGMLALAATACSFRPGSVPADSAIDGPPPVTVGFAKSSTLADEDSMMVPVRVVLSNAVDEAITVTYAVSGGTASRPNDYLLDDGTLTFAPGEVEKLITPTIGPDGTEEPDETIEIKLESVTGAGAVLTARDHVLTISANVLPRVSFALAASNNDEQMTAPTLEVTLNKASALTTSVQVMVMGGTATAGGVDYALSTTTVTFAPNDVSEQVPLTVANDDLDEDNETAIVQLDNAVNLIVGTTPMHTYTINDNDLPPTVSFDVAMSQADEGVGTVNLMVSLSGASGKNINVQFGVDNASSATGTADYTIGTASPLQFPAGTVQRMITVNVVQDTAIEPQETIEIDLTPMGGNVSAGTNLTHVLTIGDDDQTCLGSGDTTLCFAPPSQAAIITGTLNTDTSMLCSSAMPLSGWTGGPNSCFVVATSITVPAAASPVRIEGSRPLVLFATGSITVLNHLDAASKRGGTAGPGSAVGTCNASADPPDDDSSGAGGGAGGSFRSLGGAGGGGNGSLTNGGSAPTTVGVPTTLRGGCPGFQGADGSGMTGSNGADPGAGGGALYLVAGDTITVGANMTINVSGAAATSRTAPRSGFFAGGGGGGSGGMIKLHANTFAVQFARFMANGGPGTSGGDGNSEAQEGNDPSLFSPQAAAQGGSGMGTASGGNGFGGSNQATKGTDGGSNTGGGGGGGGGGYIVSNKTLTNAIVSAGDIDP